jgi:hypothetical protein
VVGADQPAVFDLAAGERSPAVYAKILKYAHAVAVTKGHKPFAQEHESFRLFDNLFTYGDRVPIIRQRQIRHFGLRLQLSPAPRAPFIPLPHRPKEQ